MNEAITPTFANQAHEWTESLGAFSGSLLIAGAQWMVLFVGVGFLLAMMLTIYLAKKRVLLRKHRGWNIAAKLTYGVAITSLLLMSGVLGAVYGVQHEVNRALYADALPAFEAQMPAMRSQIALKLHDYQPEKVVSVRDLVEPWVTDLYYQPQSDSFWERGKERWINELILRHGSKVFIEAFQNLLIAKLQEIRYAIGGGSVVSQADSSRIDQLSVDFVLKFTQDSSREIELHEIDKSFTRLFFDALSKKVNSYFTTLYGSIGMLSLLLALVVVTETFIYRRFFPNGLSSLRSMGGTNV